MSELKPSDRTAIETIVAQLEEAWNAADGERFAAPFAPDADFVNIRAEHMRGRELIAHGHTHIFRTIYAGSVNRCTLEAARLVQADVAVAHVDAILTCPSGPLAGTNHATFSMVLARSPRGWEIAAFQNTLAPRVT